ncbi:Diaminopimelate epimerase [Candidatus Westeberhardia cardiocondylae]|uniref:Diaminopimelate epimerase n=1 Tax=Candidatus Westeberhardia cardiocondylae TaxID=1594731 RepID=A0A0H5C5Q7_9ENTR|nr:diaminopimelate epimerase [Candidatus Westeberhardia cardiocondylae]CEN32296.1 Diaminopimelate epimerase [Candidatus Westeberhardia cardiocondylae]
MQFSKMYDIENDFVVVDSVTQDIYLKSKIVRRLSNRNFGIGFNKLLLIEPPFYSNVDFHYRVFDKNGIEIRKYGNGILCFSIFVFIKKLVYKKNISVSINKWKIKLNINKKNLICVNMGKPQFYLSKDFLCKNEISHNIRRISLVKKIVYTGIVFLGNFHYVVIVNDINCFECLMKHLILKGDLVFLTNIDINVMQIMDTKNVILRVYEYNLGEIKGSEIGACASVSLGIQQGKLEKNVLVNLLHGTLKINWGGYDSPVFMLGTAIHVYDGFIDLKKWV